MALSAVHQRPLVFSIVSSSLVVCSLCALMDCEGRRRFPINICILSAGFVPVIAIIVTVARSHAEEVERLKERYEAQLTEKAKESERSLEDERSRHEAEVEAMSRRHQKVVTSLDEKIAEGEKMIEKLKADKKALQIALANDSDQRNQVLTKEINSLQTALEFKSSEMKDLRQKYQQVALRVEEIPVKELEITKLKHKVIELKQALDQKLNHENGKVQFRSRSSNSDRPHSNARLSQISFCEMDRSTDRDSLIRSTVSMYASQVQLPENHADDVIYAPDEIITSSGLNNRTESLSLCSKDDVERSVNGSEISILAQKNDDFTLDQSVRISEL
ncbi:hypothetical protein NECAME_08827 [Necator americanus]|uniref:Uncharacterized protein n=1 Tax=Necator americanus TaxID=51031 RepID=W2TGL7_NECAM|nr:hypothetical protein NECAME_08827 [Necator americanus]ETN80978.1 hypothetical protein NECAME_08827 [Necator americanus]